jgi:hypothetical protein
VITDPALVSIQQMRQSMDMLRGRLFMAIEAVGLPQKQEAAFKSLVRTLTYEDQARLESILRGDN